MGIRRKTRPGHQILRHTNLQIPLPQQRLGQWKTTRITTHLDPPPDIPKPDPQGFPIFQTSFFIRPYFITTASIWYTGCTFAKGWIFSLSANGFQIVSTLSCCSDPVK